VIEDLNFAFFSFCFFTGVGELRHAGDVAKNNISKEKQNMINAAWGGRSERLPAPENSLELETEDVFDELPGELQHWLETGGIRGFTVKSTALHVNDTRYHTRGVNIQKIEETIKKVKEHAEEKAADIENDTNFFQLLISSSLSRLSFSASFPASLIFKAADLVIFFRPSKQKVQGRVIPF